MKRPDKEFEESVLAKGPYMFGPGGHMQVWAVIKIEALERQLAELTAKVEAGAPVAGQSRACPSTNPVLRELTASDKAELEDRFGINKFPQQTLDACAKWHSHLGGWLTDQDIEEDMACLDKGAPYSEEHLMTRWKCLHMQVKARLYFYKWAGLVEYRRTPRKGYYKIQSA